MTPALWLVVAAWFACGLVAFIYALIRGEDRFAGLREDSLLFYMCFSVFIGGLLASIGPLAWIIVRPWAQ